MNGRAGGPGRSNGARRGPDVIVFGQIARDLVLVVDTMPGARQAADVRQRRGRPALTPRAVQNQLSLLSGRLTLDTVMGG